MMRVIELPCIESNEVMAITSGLVNIIFAIILMHHVIFPTKHFCLMTLTPFHFQVVISMAKNV